MRTFGDDFDVKGTLHYEERTLPVTTFIKEVTLFHLLARNVARQVTSAPDELVHVAFRIDGLMNRRPRLDSLQLDPSYLANSQTGTDAAFAWVNELSLREFEREVVKMARERIAEAFWTFGLDLGIIPMIQRHMLGDIELEALPADS
jgi:hypothetical protein